MSLQSRTNKIKENKKMSLPSRTKNIQEIKNMCQHNTSKNMQKNDKLHQAKKRDSKNVTVVTSSDPYHPNVALQGWCLGLIA